MVNLDVRSGSTNYSPVLHRKQADIQQMRKRLCQDIWHRDSVDDAVALLGDHMNYHITLLDDYDSDDEVSDDEVSDDESH